MKRVKVTITSGATLNRTERVESKRPLAEYERFEDLSASLLKVPKDELDEKVKERAGS